MEGVRRNSPDPRRRTDIGVAQEDNAGRLSTVFHWLVSWRTGRFYQAGDSLSPAPFALLWGVLPPKISKYSGPLTSGSPCWGLSSTWWAQTRRSCSPASRAWESDSGSSTDGTRYIEWKWQATSPTTVLRSSTPSPAATTRLSTL